MKKKTQMVMHNVRYYVLESIHKHSLRHIKWTLMLKKKNLHTQVLQLHLTSGALVFL